MWHQGMGNDFGMMGWAGGPLMLLVWLLMLGALALLIRSLLSRPSRDEDKSLLILRERLARGEIDQAEFDRLQQALQRAS